MGRCYSPVGGQEQLHVSAGLALATGREHNPYPVLDKRKRLRQDDLLQQVPSTILAQSLALSESGRIATSEQGSSMSANPLAKEIAAFERERANLLTHHAGKFVVFKDEQLVGSFDTFDNAATEAIRRFGAGPYLIRQVVSSTVLPRISTAVHFRPAHATH